MATPKTTDLSSVDQLTLFTLFPELTERQYKALELYSLGYAQKQIVDNLNISTGTIKDHLKAAQIKLGCYSRFELRQIFLNRLLLLLLKGSVRG